MSKKTIDSDKRIEFMLTTKAIFPVPSGSYHYHLMKMEDAFAIEAALQKKSDYFGRIQRAIHPDFYPEPNPNTYYTKNAPDPYQGIVGFRFEVTGTEDIREAYKVVYDILENTVGEENPYYVGEVMVSRGGPFSTQRADNYHPKYNPS